MTDIRCPISEAADISRHEPAIITTDREIIYSEYDQYVAATAARLLAAGWQAGDRVALSLPNQWHYPVLLMAMFRAGLVACPLSFRGPAREVGPALDRLGCKGLIATPKRGAAAGVPAERRRDPEDLITFFGEGAGDDRPRLALERPATILITPGRSRKAVLHTYGGHYYNALGANHNIRASSHCRWLLTDPLSDVAGLSVLFRAALGGAAVVIARGALAETLARFKISHVSVGPAELAELVEAGFDGKKHPELQAVLLEHGGAAPGLLQRARELHLPVFASYGLTEMASQVATMRPDSPPAKRSTSGAVLMHRAVRISASGEILVKGQTLFSGYVEKGNVVPATDADGWFATGDLGALDADGYLTVTGRKPF